MSVFSKAKAETPPGALDGWVWDALKDDYVQTRPMPAEAQEVIDEAGGPVPPDLSAEDFARLYPPDTFRDNIGAILRFGGTIAGIKCCETHTATPAFSSAMEVAYRRFLAGDNAVVLKIMSSRDLVDFLIVSAWGAPFAKAVAAEVREAKAAKKMAQAPSPAKASGDGATGTILGSGQGE